MALKVATFNANSIRARIPIIMNWLEKEHPDVLCLQETKVQDPTFPEAAFAKVDYRALFRGERSYNGVAMLTKEPIEAKNPRFGLDDGALPMKHASSWRKFAGFPSSTPTSPRDGIRKIRCLSTSWPGSHACGTTSSDTSRPRSRCYGWGT